MIAALFAAAVVAAQPAPPPAPQSKPVVVPVQVAQPIAAAGSAPRSYAIRLTEQDLETIRFMATQIGSRCSATDDSFQYCKAALLARDLEISINTQVDAERKVKP